MISIPRRPLLAALAVALCTATTWPARAFELSGTAFTVVYRGPATSVADAQTSAPPQRRGIFGLPVPQPPPRAGVRPPAGAGAVAVLRLADARTGTEVARAAFNGQLDGWLFQLPMDPARVAGGGCLVLRSAAGGYLPLRDPSGADDGLSFHHPTWETELARLAELNELRRELATLDAREASAAQELQRLTTQLPGGACVLQPAGAPPPRPPAALDGADATSLAPGVCAVKWQQALPARVDLSRLFQEAGLQTDWAARERAAAAAQALPALRIEAPPADLALVADAAAKGRAFLEHAIGIQVLSRAQARCKVELPAAAQAELLAWEARLKDHAQAPEKTLRECESGKQRLDQLKARQGNAGNFRGELDRRLAVVAAALPPPLTAQALHRNVCRP